MRSSSKIIPNNVKNSKIRISWFDTITSRYHYGDWRNYNNKKSLTEWINNQNKKYTNQIYRIEYKRIK